MSKIKLYLSQKSKDIVMFLLSVLKSEKRRVELKEFEVIHIFTDISLLRSTDSFISS